MQWLFTIMIKFDKDKAVILVYVILKNKGETKRLLMALDTGATYCMIPWRVADILGLEPELYKEKIETITASGIETVPLVETESINVNNTEVRYVKIIVHDLPAKSYVDGLLGLSFLRNFNLNINFKEGYFELLPL